MMQQGGGAIVNTSSAAGLVGLPRSSGYSVSKRGVVGLTKSAALAYAKNGIRVNAVCPGYVRTPMLEALIAERPEYVEAMVAGQPIGRLGAPEEVAELVVWLCTDAASFVTGAALPVDGAYVGYGNDSCIFGPFVTGLGRGARCSQSSAASAVAV